MRGVILPFEREIMLNVGLRRTVTTATCSEIPFEATLKKSVKLLTLSGLVFRPSPQNSVGTSLSPSWRCLLKLPHFLFVIFYPPRSCNNNLAYRGAAVGVMMRVVSMETVVSSSWEEHICFSMCIRVRLLLTRKINLISWSFASLVATSRSSGYWDALQIECLQPFDSCQKPF